jgi:hypothetical protein
MDYVEPTATVSSYGGLYGQTKMHDSNGTVTLKYQPQLGPDTLPKTGQLNSVSKPSIHEYYQSNGSPLGQANRPFSPFGQTAQPSSFGFG